MQIIFSLPIERFWPLCGSRVRLQPLPCYSRVMEDVSTISTCASALSASGEDILSLILWMRARRALKRKPGDARMTWRISGPQLRLDAGQQPLEKSRRGQDSFHPPSLVLSKQLTTRRRVPESSSHLFVVFLFVSFVGRR